MEISYERYLDCILGGWIGKSLGGAVGGRFEGQKHWVELDPDNALPEKMPPNDDLDLQVLWLGVLEEKGAAICSNDLAEAWLQSCWYPFNEYGNFRRNYRLGIKPPWSGRFNNEFYETGMGCPIRSEIWGYVFPGAPDLAARCAQMDGTLDHTDQSVGAEEMFAAMASMAFFVSDVQRLVSMFIHHLPAGSPIERLARAALDCRDDGLTLREARERLLLQMGVPEACDSQLNVPMTLLALCYGESDIEKTLVATINCGYDTDCTAATALAFLGQIKGASGMPDKWRDPVGDELVMGIQYRRPVMTLSQLARDTARIGVEFSRHFDTGVHLTQPPKLEPIPGPDDAVRLNVDYVDQPCAGPGDSVRLRVTMSRRVDDGGECFLRVQCPDGWEVWPDPAPVSETDLSAELTVRLALDVPESPMKNVFRAQLFTTQPSMSEQPLAEEEFGVMGASLWRVLGVHFDAKPVAELPMQCRSRGMGHHWVGLDRDYIGEADVDADPLYRRMSRILGRPAVLRSRGFRVDVAELVGLRGEYCIYLCRDIISPSRQDVHLVLGNNDAYRLWLNGELLGERDEHTCFCPHNNFFPVELKEGRNRLLVKLLKRDERLDFWFGVRLQGERGPNASDWSVDISDANPLADR